MCTQNPFCFCEEPYQSVVVFSPQGGDSERKFQINPDTGQLSCQPLDREVNSLYNLTILAIDGGNPPQSSVSSILLRVIDVNDNDPRFTQSYYSDSIPEDITKGTSVLQVEAVDLDEGVNAAVAYSINNSAQGQFKIDNVTGVLYTAG